MCDRSFERAKTAVLCGGDVLDCISFLTSTYSSPVSVLARLFLGGSAPPGLLSAPPGLIYNLLMHHPDTSTPLYTTALPPHSQVAVNL